MPRDNSVFGQDTACVRLIGIVAFAGNSRAALAALLSVPCPIGMVFADPPYAKTNRTLFIHGIETRGPAPKIAGMPRATPLQRDVPSKPNSLRTAAVELPTFLTSFSSSSFE